MKFFFAVLILAAICAAVFGCAVQNPVRVYSIAVPDESIPVAQRPDYARHIVRHKDGSVSLTP